MQVPPEETPVKGCYPVIGVSIIFPFHSRDSPSFPLFRSFVCPFFFYKRQQSLINDRTPSRGRQKTYVTASRFLLLYCFFCPCHVLCCDHRVMGAFVWLTGHIRCDMTILSALPWSPRGTNFGTGNCYMIRTTSQLFALEY